MNNEFASWLDSVLDTNLPIEGVAVNFNVYEEGDNEWSLQIIVAGRYDDEDLDWACDEVFSSEEDIYVWTQEAEWNEVLPTACEMISDYLCEGKHADDLKAYKAVGCGFIDGDIIILHKQDEE